MTKSNHAESRSGKSRLTWLFRFRLRTLLLVITVLGVVILPEVTFQLRQRSAIEVLRPKKFTIVSYDYDLENAPPYDEADWRKYFPPVRSRFAASIRTLTGSDIFCPVIRLYLGDDSETSIEEIAKLRHLKWLQIGNPTGPFTGRPIPSLEPIANCVQLEYLALGNWCQLSLSGPEGFRGNGTIISPYDITSSDLEIIGNLNRLRILAIGGANVNDQTVQKLSGLKKLEYLYLSRSNVTKTGISQLKSHIPNVTIVELDDPDYDYATEIQSRD